MLFLAELDRMDKENKVYLLAFLKVYTFRTVLFKELLKTARIIQHGTGTIAERITRLLSKRRADSLARLRKKIEWDYKELDELIEAEREKLSGLHVQKIRKQILIEIGKLCGMNDLSKDVKQLRKKTVLETLWKKTVLEAARGYRKIELEGKDITVIEEEFFNRYLEDMAGEIKKGLSSMDPDQTRKVKGRLTKIINGMERGEREAIESALKLEKLTADTLLRAGKKGLMTGGFLVAGQAAGFGFFLATTTMIHAVFTTLLGITLPFVVYTTATQFLGFLIGPLGFLLIITGLGALTFPRTSRQFRRKKLAYVVFILRAQGLRNS